MKRLKVATIAAALLAVLFCTAPARAVGWDSDDFIISGAPTFPDRIGVFDRDFTFKGYLDQSFLGVQGMDFDAAGRLVALSSINPEVRVYDRGGAKVGGFTPGSSPMLVPAGDLKVSPDGNYALGTGEHGARVFTPQGAFVRQYGDGDSRGIAFVPGGRLWSGGAGTTVNVFDTSSGAVVGTFTADGQTMSFSMQYSPTTNTVLVVDADRDLGGIFERDLTGGLLEEFHVPRVQTTSYSATRGPGGDVFGTTGYFGMDVVHWRQDASVAATIDCYPVEIGAVRILWAGVVPEPGSSTIAVGAGCLSLLRRRPKGNE
jgi:WD40 repeat protein